MKSICGDLLLQRLGPDGTAALTRPLNRGLYACIRGAILDGSLASGTRLPPQRDLAAELALSRNTVMYAYEQLLAEGYLRARTGSGTFVADIAPERFLNATAAESRDIAPPAMPGLSPRGQRLLSGASASPVQWGAFMPGVPDLLRFPHRRYAQIAARLWRQPQPEWLSYSHGGGLPALREAVAAHLRVARSTRCDADQILITEGIHQAIDLVARMLGSAGDQAWVEEPGYWGIRGVLQLSDIGMTPMPVDAEGMTLPTTEDASTPSPRFIFVTPSHQYPLGAVMSLRRRRALLDVARRHGSWIVEDDYDSEFRYAGQPIPSLQGMEPDAPVIYIGTFSKTLYPGLRMGYIVLPKALAGPMQAAHADLYRAGHLITQATVAEFIQAGDYAAHIRRMRPLYARRRAVLAGLIERYLGPEALHEHASNAGLHLVLRLPDDVDDVALANLARDRGILVRPLSRYFSGSVVQRGLLLGYACVPEEEIGPAFDVLLGCLVGGGGIGRKRG
ncbi:PLP-dependent aminotransferase family protein [Cupriavidus pauculus]|uniref:MocR-like pyridoxine biosynthesis transcription factor PdxR n=1 Tax=Cupriavidus pauculus TaxID=82633 RepID=UPI001EE397D7|nr:PLP-dependent aminotransferase family protein [Cupriavidus pauculus]GJG97656.1 PLP-dependent aminotransferase family protein [Cupriavidus pauculus]